MVKEVLENFGSQRGICFEDANLQIGYMTEVSKHVIKISLYLGNKANSRIQDLAF